MLIIVCDVWNFVLDLMICDVNDKEWIELKVVIFGFMYGKIDMGFVDDFKILID